MRKLHYLILLFPAVLFGQNQETSTETYKKRVLENVEIDLLTSYYQQDGDHAAVTGGIGTEELTDFATNIDVAIPLNDDDVLTIDGTISAYTSASSSNLNPFEAASSGASSSGGGDNLTTGTPWVESSGASKSDVWVSGNIGYSHSSDDRNSIYIGNINFANEFDYSSTGAGVGYTRLFNEKNSELGFGLNVYMDNWKPQYPTEIKTYSLTNGDLNSNFFNGIEIFDQNGNIINKNSTNAWKPTNTELISDTKRNTYTFSLSFSQILSKNAEFSVFSDVTYQTGWLANPMQRVYFSDVDNFYIGNPASIDNYTSPSNTDVFQLADDIERLPDSRLKIPVGLRFHYYINESLIVKTYYRYYFDDWGVNSNTFNVELPIKIAKNFTLYPSYRFYNQSEADYYAPYEKHVSTSEFYTSDNDLSKFHANQFGVGVKYSDALASVHIGSLALKNISLNYNYYKRNTGLKASIVSLGVKFVFDK